MIIIALAQQVVIGNMRLGVIRDTFGSEIAARVNDEMIKRSFQPVKWLRRVR